MKFKHNVLGYYLTGVRDAIRFTCRVEDHAVGHHPFSKRFDLALQDNEVHIVSVDTRIITVSKRRSGGVTTKYFGAPTVLTTL